jgi:hypothetical protein
MVIENLAPAQRNGYAYPLVQSDGRTLPKDYEAELYLCDIDNTYIITRYKSLRDFIRLALEPAHDKRPVPGAPALMRALRHGAQGVNNFGDDDSGALRRAIYFVSASPQSMRRVLEQRLLLDEVEFDGASFRDLWAGKKPHLRHIRDIYGYKVAALLSYRLRHPKGAQEILFGDDLEFDAEVYVLYSRICAGTIRGEALDGILEERGLLLKDRKYIVQIASELPAQDAVHEIYIRKVRRRTADEQKQSPFDSEDSRVVHFGDYLQAALHLYAKGHIHRQSLKSVAFEVDLEQEQPSWLAASINEAVAAMSDTAASLIDETLRAEIEQGLLKLKIMASSEQASPAKASVNAEPRVHSDSDSSEEKGEGRE